MKSEKLKTEDFEKSVIDGELIEVGSRESGVVSRKPEAKEENLEIKTQELKIKDQRPKTKDQISKTRDRKVYLLLPFIFLSVALFGGLRFAAPANDFLFLKPALVCLIFAAILLILFFRAKLINTENWFSEDFSTLENVANASVLATLFAASVQVFNSLLPERGLPLWIIGFCFFWTLWNNLFADFDVRRLLRSLGAMFGLAFVVKYLILANLTAPANQSWWESISQNPTQSAASWLLDLPQFSAATGYIQFFALALYLLGLYLMPAAAIQKSGSSRDSSEIIS